jgi:hypothetical protein
MVFFGRRINVLRRKQDQDTQNGRLSQETVPGASPVTGVTFSPCLPTHRREARPAVSLTSIDG